MSENIFKQAVRLKLRFPSIRGELALEQLYDLPLTSKNGFDLDSVAKAVNADLKAQTEESFVETSHNPRKEVAELALAVVKEVIADRLAENQAKTNEKARKDELHRLHQLVADKQDEALKGQSLEDLQKRIAELTR